MTGARVARVAALKFSRSTPISPSLCLGYNRLLSCGASHAHIRLPLQRLRLSERLPAKDFRTAAYRVSRVRQEHVQETGDRSGLSVERQRLVRHGFQGQRQKSQSGLQGGIEGGQRQGGQRQGERRQDE